MMKKSMYLLSTIEGRIGVTKTFASAYKNATFRGGIAEPALSYRHALAKLRADKGRLELIDEVTKKGVWIETIDVLPS